MSHCSLKPVVFNNWRRKIGVVRLCVVILLMVFIFLMNYKEEIAKVESVFQIWWAVSLCWLTIRRSTGIARVFLVPVLWYTLPKVANRSVFHSPCVRPAGTEGCCCVVLANRYSGSRCKTVPFHLYLNVIVLRGICLPLCLRIGDYVTEV